MSSALQCCTLLRCAHDGAADSDARGQDQPAHRPAGPRAPVRVAAAAPHLARRRDSPERDAGEPVQDAGPHRGRGRGRAEGRGPRPGQRSGGQHRPVAAARARRRRARDGPHARPARAARPGRPPAGPGPGADRVAGRGAGLEAVHPGLVGRCHARGRPGHRGRHHRRGVRGDGLAGRPAGRDRAQARPPAPGPGREPVPDGAV